MSVTPLIRGMRLIRYAFYYASTAAMKKWGLATDASFLGHVGVTLLADVTPLVNPVSIPLSFDCHVHVCNSRTSYLACDDEARGGRYATSLGSASTLGYSAIAGKSPLVTNWASFQS